MDNSFADITPLWDLSQATTFSQLADDDFLALLQKQFPASTSPTLNLGAEFAPPSVDPNDISRFSLPSFNPPSEDSSPSPPQNQASSSRQRGDDDDEYRSDLKRKASIDEDDLEEGPSSKAQHTSASNKKGGASSRRKSGGGPDESRLLKRKEQNRAAQRAFRERKEKHVKDLEDKVAALEARNEQANTENDNLRDMLRRLQSENVQLKQGSFTFKVAKDASSTASSSSLSPPDTNSLSASFSRNSPKPSLDKYTNPLDLSSLTAFDPSMLDLLDEPTATSGGSGLESEFGFNREGGYLTSHFTTIASNPAYFSLASMFDSTPTPSPPTTTNSTTSHSNNFGFDMSSITSSWSMPTDGGDSGTLDDLFGSYLNPPNGMDMTGLLNSASPSSAISPIMHQATTSHSPSNSTSSGSPSSQGSDAMFGTPRDGSSSESDNGHEEKQCPKSKEECENHINGQGMSPFAPVHTPYLKKDAMSPFGVVACQGTSSFPRTQQNDQNIEVLSAWRKITSNPNFKDCDINELCTEFSNKARCDGSKVVLEPSGVNSILSHLSSAKQRP